MTADGNAGAALTPKQRERERTILAGLIADGVGLAIYLLAALATGSFTLLAQFVRSVPMMALESGSLVTLRRIHRRRLDHLGYGTGKVEQMLNVSIAIFMMLGSAWLGFRGLQILTGDLPVATPLGLATAAALNSMFLTKNFLVWNAQKHAAQGPPSLTMRSQVAARRMKVKTSLIVQCTMTIAALSSDHEVAAFADVGGSFYVAWILFAAGLRRMRNGLPDLLDLVAEGPAQERIAEVIAAHAPGFRRVDGVRSRRSGTTVFIEMTAVVDALLSVAEAERRAAALGAALKAAIPGADVAVQLAAAAGGAVAGGSETPRP